MKMNNNSCNHPANPLWDIDEYGFPYNTCYWCRYPNVLEEEMAYQEYYRKQAEQLKKKSLWNFLRKIFKK